MLTFSVLSLTPPTGFLVHSHSFSVPVVSLRTSQKAEPNTDFETGSQTIPGPCYYPRAHSVAAKSSNYEIGCIKKAFSSTQKSHMHSPASFSHSSVSAKCKKSNVNQSLAPTALQSGTSATRLHRGILRSVNRPICTNCYKNSPLPSLCRDVPPVL